MLTYFLFFFFGEYSSVVYMGCFHSSSSFCVNTQQRCVQVVAMRLPVPLVAKHLKAVLDGILLWSADTKNQFKLKVQQTGPHSLGMWVELWGWGG